VGQSVFLEGLAVAEDIEVPLVKIIHHLQYVGPLTHVDLEHVLEPFFFLLDLIWVLLFTLPVELFQEIIQVTLVPLCGIVGRLSRDVEPRLGLRVHVLLFG